MSVYGRKYLNQPVFKQVRDKLIEVAKNHGTITYGEVGEIMGIKQPGNHLSRETGQICGEISEEEHRKGNPLLSAAVVRSDTGLPGDGFFYLANELNLYRSSEETKRDFWKRELQRVYEHPW